MLQIVNFIKKKKNYLFKNFIYKIKEMKMEWFFVLSKI